MLIWLLRGLLFFCSGLCLVVVSLALRSYYAKIIAAQLANAASPKTQQNNTPKAYRTHSIARHRDGHFYLNSKVEGRPLVFLVDTGASSVLLSQSDAQRLGHAPPRSAYKYEFHTANGVTFAARTTLDQIRIGNKDFAKVEAYIIPEGLSVSLLGQSVLRRFQSVQMRPDSLELTW